MVSSSPLPTSQRRYLALYAPFLPCDRLIRESNGAQPDAAYVFVAKTGNAIRLIALDPAAQALGLVTGLTLADARARVPYLAVFAHDPAADRAFLERIADGCTRFTPSVELDPPDGITLDITGCTHLFGGEAELAAHAIAHFAGVVGLHRAIGDTPEAAQALARFGGDDVAALPIGALRLDTESTTALMRAGLKTVGDLAARPSAMLAARFGRVAVDRLDRLLGRANSRVTPRRRQPPVRAERRFAEPVAHIDAVMDTLDALADDVCIELERRHRGARLFTAMLSRSDGQVRRLSVESGAPMRDTTAILRLFAERIDTLADPIDPGFGYDAIRLDVARLEPLMARQIELDGGTANEDALAGLVDRLSTQLGREQVRRFVPLDTHIPEQRVLELPALDCPAPTRWPARAAGEPALRPFHLFDPPQLVEAIATVPDGPPLRFRWRRNLHDVRAYEGPERIAAEWWRRRDGKGLTRDYYRVEDARGRRFWLFRHGLYGAEVAQPNWYLHGLFA